MTNGCSSTFPTILVAQDDDGICGAAVRDLEHEGYFLLMARDGAEAIEVARVHSRPIQLMVTADSIDGRTLAATLKHFRPNMRVLFITQQASEEASDRLRSEAAVAKVRELLGSPGTEHMECRRAFAAGAHRVA